MPSFDSTYTGRVKVESGESHFNGSLFIPHIVLSLTTE